MSLKIEHAAIAHCRPEHVWRILEQVDLWTRFGPQTIGEVRWASGEPWTKSAKLSVTVLKPIAFTVTPEVLEIDSPTSVHLRGEGWGVTGDQHYIFRWMPEEQTTELRTLQEFSGGPILFLGRSIRPAIEAGIRNLCASIIEEAEAVARQELSASPGQ